MMINKNKNNLKIKLKKINNNKRNYKNKSINNKVN